MFPKHLEDGTQTEERRNDSETPRKDVMSHQYKFSPSASAATTETEMFLYLMIYPDSSLRGVEKIFSPIKKLLQIHSI